MQEDDVVGCIPVQRLEVDSEHLRRVGRGEGIVFHMKAERGQELPGELAIARAVDRLEMVEQLSAVIGDVPHRHLPLRLFPNVLTEPVSAVDRLQNSTNERSIVNC
jgi:hypothetical protein